MQVKRWNTWLLAALLATGLAAMGGCGDESQEVTEEEVATYEVGEPVADTSVAAIVTSEEYGADTLTASEFREQFEQITQRMPTMELDVSQAAELRRTIVEQFVLQHVLFGEADRIDAVADSGMIAMQMQQMQAQAGGAEAFAEMLAAQGLTEEDFREMLRNRMRGQAVQQELAGQAEEPTEEDIDAYREEQAEQVSAQHILFLVGRGAGEAEQDSVEALAEAVLDSIQGGATFAEMARRHSQDGSASEGGSLGYFSRGDMVPAFADAAFALEDSGDVTAEPVRTQYGYHLIRKTGEREGELIDTARARRMLMRNRQEEAVRAGIQRLRSETTVRINPEVVEGVDLSEPFDLLEQRG